MYNCHKCKVSLFRRITEIPEDAFECFEHTGILLCGECKQSILDQYYYAHADKAKLDRAKRRINKKYAPVKNYGLKK